MKAILTTLAVALVSIPAQASADNFRLVVDVKGILANPQLGPELRKGVEQAWPPEVKAQFKKAGIDPFKSVDKISMSALVTSAQPDPQSIIVVVRGSFNRKAIHSAMSAQQSDLKAKVAGGHTLWLDAKGNGMMLRDSRTLLIGHEKAMKRHMGGRVKLKPLPSFLKGAHVALMMEVPKMVRQQVRKNDPQSPAADIEAVMARVTFTKAKKLAIKARLRCTQAAAAQGLSMMISMGLNQASAAAPPPIAQALKGLRLRPQGKTLGIALDLSEAQLKTIASMVQPPNRGAGRSAPGGRPRGRNR